MTTEARPELWVGHVTLTVGDPARAHDYYESLGLRSVQRADDLSIAELRGGTHLVLRPGTPTPGGAPFDLMVEDLPAAHARWSETGLDVSEILQGDNHSVLVLTDLDGYRVIVFDSHVVGDV
jgi:catechol 2,3-dioxygenase-like lactoylglutathione lyase family enzyme